MPANKSMLFRGITIALLCAGVCAHTAWGLSAKEQEKYSFTNINGLKLKIFRNSDMNFVHAEIVVFNHPHPGEKTFPAFKYLTMMHMFYAHPNEPGNKIVTGIAELGGDFQVENRPDYMRISFNFLSDHIATFIQLVNDIFTYTDSFNLKKLAICKENVVAYKRSRSWKKELAYDVGYSYLYANSTLGLNYFPLEIVSKINLANLKNYYKRTFRLDNAILFIKGNVNPHVTHGLTERNVKGESHDKTLALETEKTIPDPQRRVVIINTADNSPPALFFFDAAPALGTPDFNIYETFYYALYGYLNGRIYTAGEFPFTQYKINNEFIFHQDITTVCSWIVLNSYDKIENVILQMDMQQKKLAYRPIERKEFLRTQNFITGKLQVETSYFDNDIQLEIAQLISAGQTPVATLFSAPDGVQKVSFERFVQLGGSNDFINKYKNTTHPERGVIVIIGNASTILANLKILKPESLQVIME